IAVGDALLKLAGKALFRKHKKEIQAYFGDLQFGCLREGGAEIIAHNLRRERAAGKALVAVDFRNAFNSPLLPAIAEALYNSPAFAPFFRIFALEYGAPSELLFFSGGSLHSVLSSSRGTRQGSSLGGFFFAVALQPVLRQLAAEFPSIRIYAY